MRKRGQKYWIWAGIDLHVRNHDERLSNRTLINIQVRHCPAAGTQLFIGVYSDDGAMVHEEIHESRPGETMTQAKQWGIQRAKELIGFISKTGSRSLRMDSLPRKGSRCFK